MGETGRHSALNAVEFPNDCNSLPLPVRAPSGFSSSPCSPRNPMMAKNSLLLGFEDDEEGAGFSNDAEEDGLAGLHFLKHF